MSDTIIEATYEGFSESGVAIVSNGSVLTDPFWLIKGETNA